MKDFPADLLGKNFKGIKTFTSEHVYQAAKLVNNVEVAKKILEAATPHEAAKVGRTRT